MSCMPSASIPSQTSVTRSPSNESSTGRASAGAAAGRECWSVMKLSLAKRKCGNAAYQLSGMSLSAPLRRAVLEKGSNPFGEVRAAVDLGVDVVVLHRARPVVEAPPQLLGGGQGQRGAARHPREQVGDDAVEVGGLDDRADEAGSYSLLRGRQPPGEQQFGRERPTHGGTHPRCRGGRDAV